MSLRARPVQQQPAQPGSRLQHVMSVGHAAAVGTKAPEPTDGLTLEQFLTEFDDIAMKRPKAPSMAEMKAWRDAATRRFKEGVDGGRGLITKEKARQLIDFVVRNYNGAKNLEHWFTETDTSMAKVMCQKWRMAFSPDNWKNLKVTPNGDRSMRLETGANLYGVLNIDKQTGVQVKGENQNTISMELTIVSAIPTDIPRFPMRMQQLGSELIWSGMEYAEFGAKLDSYIYQSLAEFYTTNSAAIDAAKSAKLGGTIKAK
tara:strand:- start:4068 stop:4844 length:777 start_codon:yes stop_codon:yes gene_type:complete